MVINLKQLSCDNANYLCFNYKLELDNKDIELNVNDEFLNVFLDGQIEYKNSVYSLTYKLQYNFDCNCDICLKNISDNEVCLNLSHKFFLEDKSDNFLYSDYISGSNFDLDALVLSDIILEFPMRFYCKKGCKGICLFCGINRNEEACSCDS